MRTYQPVLLAVYYLCGDVMGYCLYGDSNDCAFQCHCAVDSECDGGKCPNGCDAAPLGYNWTGPACQIGNVGLHKSAGMTAEGDYQTLYPPSAALDGVNPGIISPHCAHPANSGNNPAEWWTDLGDVYKIYNITIYRNIDCCDWRLQHFDLTVYNTSDKEVLCAHDDDRISTHRTLTCTKPVIGRYVHFKRTGGTEIQQSILCEVVIIGHKYIDCTLCPRDVACSEVTGCEECNGSYQPDCKEGCEVGFYGTNCKRECGHCKDGKACDRYHGGCSNGCEIWWTDTTCNTYIGLPNHRNESVTVIKKTTDSIQIKWQHIGGISPYLGDFYGYLIQYKADTVEDDYTEAVIVKYNSDPSWTFDNLKSGTEYWIEIKPFREYEGMKEFGTAYKVLGVNTECEELHSPSIMEAAILGENNGFIYILITYKNTSPAERFCDQITKAMLYYKLKGSTNYQFINVSLRDIENIIKVKETGEYEIKLVAQNEEGNTFSSKIHTFLVTGKSGINIGTIVLIILIVLFGMTTILLVILLLKSRINVGKERQNKHEENVGNTEMRTEATNPGTMSIESDGKGLPEQCSCEVTEHVASTEDSSINNEDFYEQNNVVVQYEDVMPTVKPKEDDQNQYEGLSPGAGRVYENRMIEGPYAEIRK